MNKGRSTLVLLIAVVVTGVVIALQETWRAKVPSKEFRRVQLFDLNPETLQSFRFESSNLVVECVKENGVWMTGEVGGGHGRADVALVYRLLAGLDALGKGTVITAEHLKMRGIDASEYGFDMPTYRITVTDNKGHRSWLIGRKVPLSKMFYAKFSDRDDIYTVSDSLQEFAPTSPNYLRDRTLFFGEIPGVRRIEIRGDGGFIQLLKDLKSGWQIQQPVAGQADAKVVTEFLKQLYKLRIEDFVAENVSDFVVYGLQEESLQISLGGADGVSRMLMVGNEIPEKPGFVYARRGDGTSVFALATNVVGLLNIKLDELRDVRVLPLSLKSISSMSIIRGADQLSLERNSSGQWMLTQPVEWKADARAVEQLLAFWGAAVITDFSDSSPLVDPEWMLEFGSVELGETNRIGVLPTFGKKDGLYIVRDGLSKPCQINLPLIPESILDPLQYKDRQIWRIKKEDIVKVSVRRDGESPQTFERSGETGAFISVLPGDPPPDPEAVSRVLNGLASVSTPEYVAYNPPRLATYGLEEPALALHVGLADTNLLGRVLLVGRETDSGFYSMVKGRDVVFLLEKPLIDLLSSDLAAVPAAGSVSPDSE